MGNIKYISNFFYSLIIEGRNVKVKLKKDFITNAFSCMIIEGKDCSFEERWQEINHEETQQKFASGKGKK